MPPSRSSNAAANVSSRVIDFATALELVAAGTVFTTHTPVAAGHDIFDHDLISHYFADYITGTRYRHAAPAGPGRQPRQPGQLQPDRAGPARFAVPQRREPHPRRRRLARWRAISGRRYRMRKIRSAMSPTAYIVPTFLAHEWSTSSTCASDANGATSCSTASTGIWIDEIPDHSYWSLRQSLKSDLLDESAPARALLQFRRNGCSDAQIERMTRYLVAARNRHPHHRLRTALRHLQARDPAVLRSRPPGADAQRSRNGRYCCMFAGKAHPHDMPGQQLIQHDP